MDNKDADFILVMDGFYETRHHFFTLNCPLLSLLFFKIPDVETVYNVAPQLVKCG
jgi:hypothetical protein